MRQTITIEQAKECLGAGRGTGKKGWFGSQGRNFKRRATELQGAPAARKQAANRAGSGD